MCYFSAEATLNQNMQRRESSKVTIVKFAEIAQQVQSNDYTLLDKCHSIPVQAIWTINPIKKEKSEGLTCD